MPLCVSALLYYREEEKMSKASTEYKTTRPTAAPMLTVLCARVESAPAFLTKQGR